MFARMTALLIGAALFSLVGTVSAQQRGLGLWNVKGRGFRGDSLDTKRMGAHYNNYDRGVTVLVPNKLKLSTDGGLDKIHRTVNVKTGYGWLNRKSASETETIQTGKRSATSNITHAGSKYVYQDNLAVKKINPGKMTFGQFKHAMAKAESNISKHDLKGVYDLAKARNKSVVVVQSHAVDISKNRKPAGVGRTSFSF